MCGPDPTAWTELIHSFVLLFRGQVLPDCGLRFATSVQALRALHHSIPLNELFLTVPFLSLADNWLLSYTPFSTPLTSISMQSLRIIHHSIPLNERIPMSCMRP